MLQTTPWSFVEYGAAIAVKEYERALWDDPNLIAVKFDLSLVSAMMKADADNIEKLYMAFPEYRRVVQLYKTCQEVFYEHFPK